MDDPEAEKFRDGLKVGVRWTEKNSRRARQMIGPHNFLISLSMKTNPFDKEAPIVIEKSTEEF